jgi:hypothetical protein
MIDIYGGGEWKCSREGPAIQNLLDLWLVLPTTMKTNSSNPSIPSILPLALWSKNKVLERANQNAWIERRGENNEFISCLCSD